MKRGIEYEQTLLSGETIYKIWLEFQAIAKGAEQPDNPPTESPRISVAEVDFGAESWTFDTIDEFVDALREPYHKAEITFRHPSIELWLIMRGSLFTGNPYMVTIYIESEGKPRILRLGNLIEGLARNSKVTELVPRHLALSVFIGHGGSNQWRELKDHLQDLHGYKVEAYETGARAGHEIRDVISSMLDSASIAFLVMTGEDKQPDGVMRARQNVVHELGLFQGRLGFPRAVVLLEEGTETFSNINGVTQIRYGKDNIREAFGEVLAVLRREELSERHRSLIRERRTSEGRRDEPLTESDL